MSDDEDEESADDDDDEEDDIFIGTNGFGDSFCGDAICIRDLLDDDEAISDDEDLVEGTNCC